jgi:hypothetical protein
VLAERHACRFEGVAIVRHGGAQRLARATCRSPRAHSPLRASNASARASPLRAPRMAGPGALARRSAAGTSARTRRRRPRRGKRRLALRLAPKARAEQSTCASPAGRIHLAV